MTECSISLWIKILSWNTSYATYFQFGLGTTPWTSYILGLLRNNTASTLCFTIANGSNSTQAGCLTPALDLNTWYHLTFTYKDKHCKIYTNGIETRDYTTQYAPNFAGITNGIIGACNNGSNYQTNCLMNDFRIYDHCLSAAEVKEIAQGLVLHYKLDSFQQGGNPNLLARYVVPGQAGPTSTANGGRTIWAGDYKITIPATENADTYFRLFMTEQLTANTVYTISCEVSGLLTGSQYNFPLFAQNNTGMGILKLNHNGLCSLTFTMTWTGTQTAATGADGETVYVNFLDDASRALASGQGPITLSNFKLEKGASATAWCPSGISANIVEDSSGYHHNGEVLNAPSLISDTPRYDSCLHISATNQKIKISNFPTSGFGNSYSFSWWAKISSASPMHWGFADGIRLNGMYTGRLWNTGDSSSNPLYKPGTTTQVDAPTVNVWHHWVMTGDGTTCKVYQDGVHWATAKTYKAISGQTIYINGWDSGTSYSSNDYSISDFRIYCTALSADDVLQLYHTSAKIDNKQNLHTFEYMENSTNLFRSELIIPWAKPDRTRIGEIIEHNGTYALNIAPEPFYKNISSTTSGALDGMFQTGSYVFDMWINTDSVIYNNNNVAGGMSIRYTDNSVENAFVFTGGNKGYQHKIYITPANKNIQRVEFYYYVSTDVFYRIDSCIYPISNLSIKKTGVIQSTGLLEETNTKFIKNGLIETNEIIEL